MYIVRSMLSGSKRAHRQRVRYSLRVQSSLEREKGAKPEKRMPCQRAITGNASGLRASEFCSPYILSHSRWLATRSAILPCFQANAQTLQRGKMACPSRGSLHVRCFFQGFNRFGWPWCRSVESRSLDLLHYSPIPGPYAIVN